MSNHRRIESTKPPIVTFVQILFYATAVINGINGIYSLGSPGMVKKALCVIMILTAIASVYAAYRLSIPALFSRYAANVLCTILIVTRIAEFAAWHSTGFLLGIILPVIVLWRINSPEAKAWFH
ncbi:hypothetical protein ABID47_003568 [Paenibacillus favisporus]|uniref:Uncharacterized protein n=1 Tax=Paenibacillus favisporus TaxID=221028 RepID=A0ABV2F5D1_9BACL